MKRTASAVWQGELKQGRGSLTVPSGTLQETPYSFRDRFESGTGTNPEELIAAAHAGCFAMALSAALGGAGIKPERIATRAELTLEQVQGNWTITAVHLDLAAKVPGLAGDQFQEFANGAKANCPVSKVLNAKITLSARLEG